MKKIFKIKFLLNIFLVLCFSLMSVTDINAASPRSLKLSGKPKAPKVRKGKARPAPAPIIIPETHDLCWGYQSKTSVPLLTNQDYTLEQLNKTFDKDFSSYFDLSNGQLSTKDQICALTWMLSQISEEEKDSKDTEAFEGLVKNLTEKIKPKATTSDSTFTDSFAELLKQKATEYTANPNDSVVSKKVQYAKAVFKKLHTSLNISEADGEKIIKNIAREIRDLESKKTTRVPAPMPDPNECNAECKKAKAEAEAAAAEKERLQKELEEANKRKKDDATASISGGAIITQPSIITETPSKEEAPVEQSSEINPNDFFDEGTVLKINKMSKEHGDLLFDILKGMHPDQWQIFADLFIALLYGDEDSIKNSTQNIKDEKLKLDDVNKFVAILIEETEAQGSIDVEEMDALTLKCVILKKDEVSCKAEDSLYIEILTNRHKILIDFIDSKRLDAGIKKADYEGILKALEGQGYVTEKEADRSKWSAALAKPKAARGEAADKSADASAKKDDKKPDKKEKKKK